MVTTAGTALPQGQSLKRPPFFDGTNYHYWKARMKVFIQSMNYDLWNVIENGPYRPTKTVNGKKVEKNSNEWDERDMNLIQLNAKATHILYCGLDKNSFAMVYTCESAKEMWDRLEVIHEGTSRLKESKINILVQDYELFRMKHKESIADMFVRFKHITNALHSLGKTYTDDELVKKILRILPNSWKPKVTAIRARTYFVRLNLNELLGLLKEYEIVMRMMETENRKKKKGVALKHQSDEENSDSL